MRLMRKFSRRRTCRSMLTSSRSGLRMYAAASCLISAGCTPIVRIGTSGDDVSGISVQSTIDYQLVPQTFHSRIYR